MLHVIAVDGPAGAGKSTVCAALAGHLGFLFVPSGAIYRAVAWVYTRYGGDEPALVRMLERRSLLSFDVVEGRMVVLAEGKVIERELYTPEVARGASVVSQIPAVRAFANAIQRSLAERTSVVVEGRDVTTVVFPQACLKVFLSASPEVRARRRWKELIERGVTCSFDEVLRDLVARDSADSSRAIAPLVRGAEVVVVDTSEMSVEEVVSCIVRLHEEAHHLGSGGKAL